VIAAWTTSARVHRGVVAREEDPELLAGDGLGDGGLEEVVDTDGDGGREGHHGEDAQRVRVLEECSG